MIGLRYVRSVDVTTPVLESIRVVLERGQLRLRRGPIGMSSAK